MTTELSEFSTIRIGKRTFRKIVVKKTLINILSAVLVIAFVYFSIAATIVRFVPQSSNLLSPILIKSNNYDGGIIPENKTILISMNNKIEHDMMSNLKNSVIPQSGTSIVKVIGGPFGKIDIPAPGVVSLDGKPYTLDTVGEPPQFLENQYLVTCIEGTCNPGVSFVVPSEYIYGVTAHKYALKSEAK